MFKRLATIKSVTVLGGLVLAAGLAFTASPAQARVYFGVGIAPFYYPGPFYGPGYYGPNYYGPSYYGPPPVAYVQPQVTYTQPAAQSWYYCDSPKGYYPYVTSCAAGWRQVQASGGDAAGSINFRSTRI